MTRAIPGRIQNSLGCQWIILGVSLAVKLDMSGVSLFIFRIKPTGLSYAHHVLLENERLRSQ